jgi:thioesterase domain-containing protein
MVSSLQLNKNRYLCPLARAGSGSPLFLIPSAGATPISLGKLARSVEPRRPIYSFGFAGMEDDNPPHDNVEEMAAAYIAEIRHTQPTGPYHVGGHCFGGTVALDIATQLRKQGERVALLVLLDTMAPWIAASESNYGGTGHLDAAASAAAVHVDKAIKIIRDQSVVRLAPLPLDVKQRFKKVLSIHIDAAVKYKSNAAATSKIVLLRTRSYDEVVFRAWRRISSDDFSEFEVPGDTFSMLVPPHVSILGKQLGDVLSGSP